MKILIIEDNRISALISKEILSEFGECDIVNDGISGLNKYISSVKAGYKYDIICLDIIMPICSGYQTLENIRAFEKSNNVKDKALIIMTSGLNEKSNIEDAYKLGADGYFQKPIQVAEFKQFIKSHNI